MPSKSCLAHLELAYHPLARATDGRQCGCARSTNNSRLYTERDGLLKQLYYWYKAKLDSREKSVPLLTIPLDLDSIIEGEETGADTFKRFKNVTSNLSFEDQDGMQRMMLDGEFIPDVIDKNHASPLLPFFDIDLNMYPPPIDRCVEPTPARHAQFLPYFHFESDLTDLRRTDEAALNMAWWRLKVEEQPLFQTLAMSKKLHSLQAWQTAREELIQLRVLQRIEDLKEEGKWSFYQLRQHKSIPRHKTHWDYVLEEIHLVQQDRYEASQ
ncbi:chromatin modification- protein VID21, partial [Spiromyces aspiralis]